MTTLAVAGDTVFDPNGFEVWNRWENNAERFYLVDRAGREETPVRMGAITDLSAFSANTQVSDLSPLTECDFGEAEQRGGVRINLDNIPCRDFSPLASIGHFRNLNVNNIDVKLWREAVRDCRIEELECVNAGIDNEALPGLLSEHPELRQLCISWTQGLTDLTPLLELDALEEVRVSRDMQAAIDSLNGKDLRFRLEIEG